MFRKSLLLLALALGIAAQAQTSNLLQNPSFEGENFTTFAVSPTGDAYFNVPEGWRGGVVTTPGAAPWQNVVPNGYPHFGGTVWNGRRSYHVSRGGGQFTAWISQTVATVPNTPLDGGAWAYIEKNDGTSQVRAGIDPTGGTNPFAPTVIWGPTTAVPNDWQRASVRTTATGTAATFFLFMTQTNPGDPNGVYWDDAILNGQGGGSIVPPPPQTPAPTGQVVTTNNVEVNVRAAPSRSGTRLGIIGPNTAYAFLGTEGDWTKIDYNGQVGYVASQFVSVSSGSPSPGAPSAPPPASPTGVSFTADFNVNIRAVPAVEGRRLGRVSRGETVALVARSRDGQWAQVSGGGWVALRFGRVSGDPASLPLGN